MLYKNGESYNGEWKQGKPDGFGLKLYADGSRYHGEWLAGQKFGKGIFTSSLGIL